MPVWVGDNGLGCEYTSAGNVAFRVSYNPGTSTAEVLVGAYVGRVGEAALAETRRAGFEVVEEGRGPRFLERCSTGLRNITSWPVGANTPSVVHLNFCSILHAASKPHRSLPPIYGSSGDVHVTA